MNLELKKYVMLFNILFQTKTIRKTVGLEYRVQFIFIIF